MPSCTSTSILPPESAMPAKCTCLNCEYSLDLAILKDTLSSSLPSYGSCKANSPHELEHAFMLMEDLEQDGQMASTVMGLDKDQVEQAIDVLAMVHALSLSVPRSEELLEQMRFKFSMDDEVGENTEKFTNKIF